MAPENGALGSVVTHETGIPAAQSLGQQHGNSNYHLSQPKGKELLAGASGKNENFSLVDIDVEHNSSDSLDQDRRTGRFYLDNAQAIASLVGGNDHGDMQRINHTLVPLEVQSLQQRPGLQPGNSSHPQSLKRKRLLVGGGAGAGVRVGDKSGNASGVVEDQGSSDVILDLDIKKKCPRCPHQPPNNDDDSICRICHMNSGAGEIVKLGCACKLELGQAHKRCANTWFAFRGNWECEICGETARNMKPLELMERDDHHPDGIVRVNIRSKWVRVTVVCILWIVFLVFVFKVLVAVFERAAQRENRNSDYGDQ